MLRIYNGSIGPLSTYLSFKPQMYFLLIVSMYPYAYIGFMQWEVKQLEAFMGVMKWSKGLMRKLSEKQ